MKRRFVSLIAILLVIAMLAACGNGGGTTAPPADGGAATPAPGNGGAAAGEVDELIVVVGELPVSMDPQLSNDMFTAYLLHQMYDTLVSLNPVDLSIDPNLAVSWDMPDAQTLNMELRDGVYFHNGDRLTANDVRFTLLRGLEMPHVSFIIDMISDVVVHDDLNFTIELAEPFAPILSHLAHSAIAILNERAITELGANYNDAPVGTGPFQMESFTLGDRVELTRFEQYWGQMPVFSRLSWRAMPEATNRLIEVESGNAHMAIIINPSDIQRAEASENLTLHRRQNLQAIYLGMQTQKAPFDDVRVRQAINYALDIELISEVVYEGSGNAATGPITEIVWGAYPMAPFPQDLDRARELMADAGLEDGFATTLWYNVEDQQYAQMATIIQNQLREINIDVTIESFDWPTYLNRTEAGDHEMFILSWITITGDADYGLFDTWHTSGFGFGNRTFWGSPEIDALLEEGRFSLDPQRRLEIYREIQMLTHESSARIYLHHAEELHVTVPNLRGLIINPNGVNDLWRVYFD
ncbi:MAG: ABC transporter substrate-binding protein [Oscillospiraceae bacterium]|nr:ABC transporter substrate-binding protein [Oscillospiraceae bacterium]